MKPIKAIIVEDSRLARNELKLLLEEFKNIEIIDEAENVDVAFEKITTQQPDLIFLDVNMPEKDGFQLLEMLDSCPITIFTTAYDEYAIKSFEYNALDYLMKPVSSSRLKKAIEKAEYQMEQIQQNENDNLYLENKIFIKEGENCWLVKLSDIILFEISGNYTKVFFDEVNPMIYKSLNQIEAKLPDKSFFRINRQQIININHIEKVDNWFNGKLKLTLKNTQTVEISRRQSLLFKELLSI